jgi:hypothetical protein
MKAIKLIGKCLFLSLSMLALSCSSSDDDGGGGGGSTPSGTYIKAKVDGTQYVTYNIQGFSAGVATSSGSGSGRLIMITGGNDMNGNTAFSINLLGINATGTYDIGPDSDSTLAFVMTGGSGVSYDTSNCAGATGTINITTLNDTKVEGTFSFTGKDDENCTDSKSVTSGSFRGEFM